MNTAALALAAAKECRQQLGDQLDVILVHLPWESSSDELADVWQGLVQARAVGLERVGIGGANFNRAQIEALVNATGVYGRRCASRHPCVSYFKDA